MAESKGISKTSKKVSLHEWIAMGNDPKDYVGANRDFGTTKENSSKKK